MLSIILLWMNNTDFGLVNYNKLLILDFERIEECILVFNHFVYNVFQHRSHMT